MPAAIETRNPTQQAPIIPDGATPRVPEEPTNGHYATIDGEPYTVIFDVDRLSPFMMSVVSNTDIWLFAGSNSGFTAGRVDPDRAIFPYRTADKILRDPCSSGCMSAFLVERKSEPRALWTPWRPGPNSYKISRNLYKHAFGTKVIFEEINHCLDLRLRWSLTTSEHFGVVRHCTLENTGAESVSVRYLDGWLQLLPPGVNQELFARYSYLATAYMRHECLDEQALGIYTLNSGVSDRPEPSEALRATCAWSIGHTNPTILLSERQAVAFQHGAKVQAEHEIRGEFGSYLAEGSMELAAKTSRDWFNVIDTGLDHAAIVALRNALKNPDALKQKLIASLDANASGLKKRIAAADGLQQTANRGTSVHHFANVLFNCMRGGTLNDGFRFPSADFTAYLGSRNQTIASRHAKWLGDMPQHLTLDELHEQADARKDPQLTRLAREYLPLSFSRRHGDPSRPWNKFALHFKDDEGNPIYGYQGNWRDIFQNWESLAQSYPACLGAMISVFLNASTADGYNPYRITRNDIDWELLDPNDPWSHIGYWGDHQIVYLLRLLESHEKFRPGQLAAGLHERLYAYAMVPYEIGGFDDLVRDPRNSIAFNKPHHDRLMARAAEIGGDGKLVPDHNGEAVLVSLAEKLLVPLLVKLSNFIPGGGIWLNTQRPEWNDANNALAGWGLSVVTVSYMRRHILFLDRMFAGLPEKSVILSEPVADLLRDITRTLGEYARIIFDDRSRLDLTTILGKAGEAHRYAVYNGSPDMQTPVEVASLREFFATALEAVDSTLRANRRPDGMYHSYNLLSIRNGQASVRHLYIMLEGQVSILSSGLLNPEEVLALLKSLRASDLYRADQHSYLLYPDRDLAPFLSRNILPEEAIKKIPLLAGLSAAKDRRLVTIDEEGAAHFQADLTNENDLHARLDQLATDTKWSEAVGRDRKAVLELWESVFHHSSFTGRSGTMFAFEGLGSIYWHMIAKLLLAVQECVNQARRDDADAGTISRLKEAYDDIRSGLGFTKTAETYGAFPTDPYSHSPRHRGAQQPGMTGQVKEEILTRLGELGVEVTAGRLRFAPHLLHRSEFFNEGHTFAYVDLDGNDATWELPAKSLVFTYCQVPVCYELAPALSSPSITIERANGATETIAGNTLPTGYGNEIFSRNGSIYRLIVSIPQEQLRA
ncbi:MAG: hypothetical protein WCD79_16935 [Chthoniobacteraceae bacterium]